MDFADGRVKHKNTSNVTLSILLINSKGKSENGQEVASILTAETPDDPLRSCSLKTNCQTREPTLS